MTGDELAIALHAEQGYLVVSHHSPFQREEAFLPRGSFSVNIPLLIVGPATKSQYAEQVRRARKISGRKIIVTKGHKYFYRVEAAD